jgi:site-specific recombinase XerC
MKNGKILKLIDAQSVTLSSVTYRQIHSRELKKIASDFFPFPSTEGAILSVIRTWEKQGIKASTIKTRLSRLNVFYNWAVKHGHFKANPVNLKFAPKVNDQRAPQGLTKGEVDLLLKQIPKSTWMGKRDRLALALMITNGYRISTVVNIKWNDFYYEGEDLYINTWEKGNKLTTKRIRPDVAKMVHDFYKAGLNEK